MIKAIGFDIVDVERIAKAMENPRFTARILTEKELELIGEDPMRVAGRWAAKEAIYKALRIQDLQWQDVEILGEVRQAPAAFISHPEFAPMNVTVHVSISHERGHAGAVAIVEG